MKLDDLIEKIDSIDDILRRRELFCKLLLKIDEDYKRVYRAWKDTNFPTEEDEK